MKNIFILVCILFSTLAYSQNNWCATNEMLEESFQNSPEKKAQFFAEQANLMNLAPSKGGQNSKAPTITVPVVVHVIHYNGQGNITTTQIQDGIDVLNADFQKLNSDTTQTRLIFKSVAADSQIQFKLATADPNGNCTNGINRINSYLTFNQRDEVKALSYWNSRNYLNIWLVSSIRPDNGSPGTTLGYAQFPNNSNLATYGLVVRHDQWGDIGTSVGTGGRTATHEVGHCFGLLHTFQPTGSFPNGCGQFCNTSSDYVCDTPPAAAPTYGCNYNNNQCSNDASGGISSNPNPYTSNVPDQLENYMSYDDCQSLFTEGQKDRMQAAFSVYSHLDNLRSFANLVATGTNSTATSQLCPPKADIIDQEIKLICQGGSITFTEDSYGDTATSYLWQLPGATPSTATTASPTVIYNTAGLHNVTLIATNSAGSDTLVVQDFVKVDDINTAFNGFNYFEGFENALLFGANWTTISPTGNTEWLRTTASSYTGSTSVFLDNYNNNGANESDFLISPSIDLTQVINPTFKFRVAYKTQTGANDVIKCAISIDCGQTWITRLFLNSGSMNSGTLNNANYIPNNPADWREFPVSTTGVIRASDNALFRFEFVGGNGNNIFIDDFRVDGQPVGFETLKNIENTIQIYPNPTSSGKTTLSFKLDEASENGAVYLTDILGKRVKEVYNGLLNNELYTFNIQTAELESGIYFISIISNSKRITKKIIVQ